MATFGGRDYKRPEGGGNDTPREEPRGTGRDEGRGERDNRDGGRDEGRGERGGGYGGGNRGGGGYNRGGGSRDENFAFISFLYGPSKKGAYSVFLKKDMLELIQGLEEDDILGISQNDRGWSLWARKGEGRGGGRR